MKMKKNSIFKNMALAMIMMITTAAIHAQSNAIRDHWNASWIAAQGDDGLGYGVYHFIKTFELDEKPSSFIIHVSADNRYKLYVNDSIVSMGPARGDLHHWNYETINIAPFLSKGSNRIYALVWNEAQFRPEAINSLRTAFIVQGHSPREELLNTNKSWKCKKDEAYSPIAGFFAASTGELVNMNAASSTTDYYSQWPDAAQLFEGRMKGMSDGFGWMLVPSPLPQMELSYQRIPSLRKTTGMKAPAGFPLQKNAVTVPANTTAIFLLDQTFLTNAYVTLQFSKGKDAGISMRYAESLYEEFNQYGGKKGNRDVVEGKQFSGRKDSIISNGLDKQTYTNLNFRTFRYIQLIVQTKQQPLVIDDIYGTFTGYPFERTSQYDTNNEESKKILDIGWRTARLNAFETYTDCPYYEQLQYIGDTRVQAMITYYNTDDDRLARNAIELMDHSRLPDGVTLSRYPSRNTQIISTFSLWYIGMLHDYWMYRSDSEFIRNKLVGARSILDFFSRYQQEDGSLKDLPYWNFVDWVGGKNWDMGSPKPGAGTSSILDLQLLWAYQWASEMEAAMGMKAFANLYNDKASQLVKTIQQKYWVEDKGLYADTEEKNSFSQHANALAILTGMVKGDALNHLGKQLLADSSMVQCTIYFKYYLHQALVKAGLGNDYMNWLGIWRDNIRYGLTTWTEDSNMEYTRSDCHAWGSSPNIEFFRTILGIDTDAPGFRRIKIEPHLGSMKKASGKIPHPGGSIAVKYALDKGRWTMKIQLPEQTSGTFIWKNKNYPLKAGANLLTIKD